MNWKRALRKQVEKEVMEKMFAWVGTYYSEGPRPAAQGDESPSAGTYQTVVPKVKDGKVVSHIVNIYSKDLLRRVYTEVDVVNNILRQLKEEVGKRRAQ